jgi:hypothetical protein
MAQGGADVTFFHHFLPVLFLPQGPPGVPILATIRLSLALACMFVLFPGE